MKRFLGILLALVLVFTLEAIALPSPVLAQSLSITDDNYEQATQNFSVPIGTTLTNSVTWVGTDLEGRGGYLFIRFDTAATVELLPADLTVTYGGSPVAAIKVGFSGMEFHVADIPDLGTGGTISYSVTFNKDLALNNSRIEIATLDEPSAHSNTLSHQITAGVPSPPPPVPTLSITDDNYEQATQNFSVPIGTTLTNSVTWVGTDLEGRGGYLFIRFDTVATVELLPADLTVTYGGSPVAAIKVGFSGMEFHVADIPDLGTGGTISYSVTFNKDLALNNSRIEIATLDEPSAHSNTLSHNIAVIAAPPLPEVWVDDDYTPDGYNDGHTWDYDAFAKIQDGIDAVAGSIVHVAAGQYVENITLEGGVQVLGAGADVTTIDGGGSGAVVTIGSTYGPCTGPDTVLEGFTVRNGGAAGIETKGDICGGPVIQNNIIRNNQGWGIGSAGTIKDNIISHNGGGISFWGFAVITGNTITENGGHGVDAANTSTITVINCIVVGNNGDGLHFLIPSVGKDGPYIIANNTIAGNSNAGISSNRAPGLSVVNNIVANNSGFGTFHDTAYNWGEPSSDYNDIWGNTSGDYGGLATAGANDISSDPMFVNATNGIYRLQPSSPCIDTGTNEGAPTEDIEGNPRPIDGDGDGIATTDMGAYENVPIPPIAAFSAEPIAGVAPLAIEFTDKSTGDITSCLWDFGDGSTSDEENPSHTYSMAGIYTVSLDVSGPGGADTETKEGYIIVYEQEEATIDFNPNTLNLKSKGKMVTVYIELPESYNVEEIDIATVMLNGIVPALAHPTDAGDYDSDGVSDLMVKFDRSDVQSILSPGDEIELTVSGELNDGTPFEGTDTIRVTDKGKK